MPGNLSERLAAIFRGRKYPSALRTHHGHEDVDKRHQKRAEYACLYCALRNLSRFLYTKPAYRFYYNNTECKPCQGIHCIISFQKSLKEGSLLILRSRRDLADHSCR